MEREVRALDIQNSIRKVLNEHWDPLGAFVVGPEDEYDSLIGPIYSLLRRHGSKEEIVAILQKFEESTGGVSSDPVALDEVSELLKALDVRL